ncbi:juvenile hormone esterase-like [Choristoneura fumiferana]|uniref:juvenile hormone esterase-like n=1 Tax=Choristoneura fumiferana TaxID=7141 RepID=UPI003D15C8D4
MTSPIVEISQGKLQGYQKKTLNNKNYYGFMGIPYAKPPTGELRFLAPEPPEQWEGVRDATKTCNICAQFDRATQVVIGDEDCLYLNVYTPELPNKGKGEGTLPVMVFVHGGGFMYGDGTDPDKHGPDYLVERDVILVSFNYRLGILGFLSLDCKGAPGNMGLKDQVQALKWVQKNISQFGGDPGNVTVFGVSAGGASVEYLLLSPMARGLFHKALKQSGSSLLHWARNDHMRDVIMKIPQIKENNITDDDKVLQLLKNLPYKDLIKASVAAVAAETDWKGGILFRFVPTVEKPGDWEPFIDRSPYELLSRGEFAHVPVVAGFCSREGLLMQFCSPHVLEKFKQNKKFLDHLPFAVDDAQKAALEAELKSVYSESESRYGEDDEYAIDFFSDIDFIGGVYVSAVLLAKSIPVYLYEFSYDGKLNYLKTKLGIKSPGACHGDDGGYIMSSALLPVDNISETDKLVRDRMVAMFTNFAKYGDPTPAEDGLLPVRCERLAASPAPARCLRVDSGLAMRPFGAAAREQLLRRLYEGHYAPK